MRDSIALAALLLLAACGQPSEEADADAMVDDGEEVADSDLGDPDEVVAGETYSEFDERRDRLEGERGSYAGYGCTVDCSGHEAGYRWAAEKGITDPDSCGGKSWSFIEGCRAYAEGNGGY
jgi:hypothetical protein